MENRKEKKMPYKINTLFDEHLQSIIVRLSVTFGIEGKKIVK